MEKGIQELLLDAGLIYGAQTENFNDAERVGQMFIDIIEYIKNHESTWSSGGSGPSPITGYGDLLTELWDFNNPDANNKILIYNNGWDYGPLPENGGPGGGLDVAAMWGELTSNEPSSTYYNTLINKGHLDLSDCLKTNATFWGNPVNTSNPNLHTVTGSLSGGIEYIEFNNGVRIYAEEGNYTLKVYAPNNTGQVGHIYATGGVSALGYSSSGGGDTPTPGGTSLDSGILKHINSYTLSSITESTTPNIGDIITWSSSGSSYRWMYMPNTLDNLKNVTITDPANGEVLMYRKQGTSGYWYNGTVETMTSVELSNVGGVTLASGVSDYPIVLGKAKSGDFTNIPLGNLISAGDGIDISSRTESGNTKLIISTDLTTDDLPSGIPVNKLAASSVTFNGASASLGSSGTITPELVIDGNTIKSKVGNQTSGGITVPFATTAGSANTANSATTAGTCTGNAGSATRLQDNTSHTIWGNTYWNNGVPNTVDSNTLTFGTDTTTVIKAESSKNIIQTTSTQSNLFEGYRNQPTQIFGKTTRFYGSSGYSGKNNALTLYNDVGHYNANDADGNNYCSAHFPLATTLPMSENTYTGAGAAAGVRIGEAILYWDAKNEALALCKYTGTANPGVANFYATGGVSALGMSSGSGSVPAMTFGNLTVTSGAAINALNTSSGSFIANSSGAKLGANKTFELNDGSVIQFNYDNSGTTLPIKLSARADGLYVSIGTNSAKKILTAS